MESKRFVEKDPKLQKDDLIVITGAGGFIAGIEMITHCDELIATPINLGSSELVSINDLVTKVEKIAGIELKRKYDLSAPRGVAGRNSDNTFIKHVLHWDPSTPLDTGLRATFKWIKQNFDKRKKGKRVDE